MKSRARVAAALMVAAAMLLVPGLLAQHPYEWPVYGRDPAGSKYSPLKQISTSNVAKLQRAWTYAGGEKGVGSPEITPIVAGGMMYISTPKQRVVALEPE